MTKGLEKVGDISKWRLRLWARGDRGIAVAVVVYHALWSGGLNAGEVVADVFGCRWLRRNGDW